MYKMIVAAALAITMTATASAHIWNRAAAPATFGQTSPGFHPCPVSYAFKSGFCVRAPISKKAWFAHAIERIL